MGFRTPPLGSEFQICIQNFKFKFRIELQIWIQNSRFGFKISELDSELQIWIQKLRFGFRTEDLDSELQTLKFGNEY